MIWIQDYDTGFQSRDTGTGWAINRDWQTSFVKGYRVNILGFAGHIVSGILPETIGKLLCANKTLFTKQTTNWIWHTGQSFRAPGLKHYQDSLKHLHRPPRACFVVLFLLTTFLSFSGSHVGTGLLKALSFHVTRWSSSVLFLSPNFKSLGKRCCLALLGSDAHPSTHQLWPGLWVLLYEPGAC